MESIHNEGPRTLVRAAFALASEYVLLIFKLVIAFHCRTQVRIACIRRFAEDHVPYARYSPRILKRSIHSQRYMNHETIHDMLVTRHRSIMSLRCHSHAYTYIMKQSTPASANKTAQSNITFVIRTMRQSMQAQRMRRLWPWLRTPLAGSVPLLRAKRRLMPHQMVSQ